jgi:hypothetical protein
VTKAKPPIGPDGDELVLTSGGWRPKSTVHRVERGQHVSTKGGRLRKIDTASGEVLADYGEISAPPPDKPELRKAFKKSPEGEEPYPDDGWIVDSEWTNTGAIPISYFSTHWIVPPVPATQDGQTIFLFNGLTPTDNSYILQPVLQRGELQQWNERLGR